MLMLAILSVSFAARSQADSCKFSLEECRNIGNQLNYLKELQTDYNLLKIDNDLAKIEIEVRKQLYLELAELIKANNVSKRKWRKARLTIANKVR